MSVLNVRPNWGHAGSALDRSAALIDAAQFPWLATRDALNEIVGRLGARRVSVFGDGLDARNSAIATISDGAEKVRSIIVFSYDAGLTDITVELPEGLKALKTRLFRITQAENGPTLEQSLDAMRIERHEDRFRAGFRLEAPGVALLEIRE